jgi:hypothetical protein
MLTTRKYENDMPQTPVRNYLREYTEIRVDDKDEYPSHPPSVTESFA